MKRASNAPTPLNDDQLAALDVMQSVAADGLNADDSTTLEGLADVIAGRTYDEAQSRVFFEELREKLTAHKE